MMLNQSETQYFVVKLEKRDYYGERLFKVRPDKNKIQQVCIDAGFESKKGKVSCNGIYHINKDTFIHNYLVIGIVEEITKTEYDYVFDNSVESMRGF